MKKILAMILAIMMLLSMAACGQGKPAETTEAPTVAPTTETPTEATEELESGAMIDGLQVTVFKVLSRRQIVVRFNQDRWGYTDVENYYVVDESGKQYIPETCNSAFWDMGGEIPDVFMMVFPEPLPVGNYTITVSNIKDALTEPYHIYNPCETTLQITEDIPEGAAGGAEPTDAGALEVEVYQIMDPSNVVVRFAIECIGCTDAPNYVVTNAEGKEMAIVSAQSAFVELGSGVPNVFKLTFAEPLAAGTYKLVVKNMASMTVVNAIYAETEIEFTVE